MLTLKVWPQAGEKEPDSDPLDQQGHGTHVSGIIAGKSDMYASILLKHDTRTEHFAASPVLPLRPLYICTRSSVK